MGKHTIINVGDVFENWTIISPPVFKPSADGRQNNQFRLCRCSCGTEREVLVRNLTRGRSTSCGCKQYGHPYEPPKGKRHKNKVTNTTNSAQSLINILFSQYRHSAHKRGLAFEVDEETFKEFVKGSCHYCGSEPCTEKKHPTQQFSILYNGIDRIDSRLGYLPGNMVSCCKMCNSAKSNKDYGEFTTWIARIKSFNFIPVEN